MKEIFLEINGVNIFTKIMGAGKPLVFLHGGPGGEHRFFLPHAEELVKEFQLIFYDQNGCGQSGLLEDPGSYTMQREIETLEELRKKLGIEKLNLIGESWGSMLALLYATQHPGHVDRILLTAAVGATVEGFNEFERELNSRLSEEDQRNLQDILEQMKTGAAQVDQLFNIINPYYVHSSEALERKTKTKSNPEVNAAVGKDISSHYDLRETLSLISHIPVKIVQGERDLITPQKLDELLIQYIPHAELTVLERCGHWTIVEQPDAFNEAVREFFHDNGVD